MNVSSKRFVGSWTVALLITVGIAVGQSDHSATASIELFSPHTNEKSVQKFDNASLAKSCLNLITLKYGCSGINFHYGNRFGENWDIFTVSGGETGETRGIDLGKLRWDDPFLVPEIEPSPKLDMGQQRKITIKTSGADGKHGRNADGTLGPQTTKPVSPGYGDKPVEEQVRVTVESKDGLVRSIYNPFIQIAKDHIYAFRVVDATNDFYMLVRVDELTRGTTAVVSFKKVAAPTLVDR